MKKLMLLALFALQIAIATVAVSPNASATVPWPIPPTNGGN